MAGTKSTNLPPCSYYLRGTCIRGETCQFPHIRPVDPLNSPDRPTAFPKAPCKFFLSGHCRNGDQCEFKHPTTNQSNDLGSQRARTSTSRVYYPGSRVDVSRSPDDASWRSGVRGPANMVPLVFGRCKFFAKGLCTKGTACPFSHLLEPGLGGVGATESLVSAFDKLVMKEVIPASSISTPQEREDPKGNSDPNTVQRTFFGCKIVYGAGAAVQEISTAFESQFIIISNLPRDITQTKLIALAECFGNVQTLTIDSSSTSFPIAKIKFAILEDAVRAIKGLNGESFESKRLEARMDLRAVEDGLATLRSTKVKLSWFAPTSQRAWAHYDGITTARQQALALDGKSFNGSKVSAFFQMPKPRQIGSFSVELRGLPRNPPSHSLKIFSSAKSITIDKPSYNLRSAIEEMKVLLSRYGKLESFEVLPVDSKKPKIVAFAQFSSPDAAELAVKGLHSKRQTFLEESPVWLEHVHTLKYMVPALQFAVLKQDIDLLGDSQTECKLRYYETDETGRACDSVCIRVFSTESKALGKVKAILDGFMRGELYKTAESGGWDGYFNSPEAQFFLRNLSQRTKGYVRCDARSRTLHLFGTTAARELLKEALGRKLSELAERRHIIHLDRTQLRSLIGGGYKALASLVEEKSLLLNVVKRTLTVTGDKENVRKVREAIALGTTTGHSAEEAPTMAFDSDCPVCFCDPTEPILLPCGHRYCQVCLQHLLRAACSANSSMVTCVMDIEGSDGIEACGTRVPIPVIRNLLEPTEEEDLFKATFLAHIHSRPEEFHYCPSPDCEIIYKQGVEGTVLRCPSCITRICASCHVEFHDGQSCEEYQDLKSGDKAFEKWRKMHGAKPCPKCGVTLEKNGGCNHMTCTRCGAHICWVCMRVFSNTDRGDDGVYAHMRREHGGIST